MPVSSPAAALAALEAHRVEIAHHHLRDLFAADPTRAQRYRVELDDLLFDYSKHRATDVTLGHLISLAGAVQLEDRRAALFTGEAVNTTEERAALHMALRNFGPAMQANGEEVSALVRKERNRLYDFARGIRDGQILSAKGERFAHIVNIGIGGSDLGPAMAARALSPFVQEGLSAHFVSNVDGADLSDTLKLIDPSRALFIISSKTFTTQETMANARSARALLVKNLGEAAIADHFAAVSTKLDLVAQFGIAPTRVFAMWDWVGGRYSMWSSIGLALAILIGPDHFEDFLRGGFDIDRHFQDAPVESNIPILMGLLGAWYRNVWGYGSHAVIPYDQRLARFPAYLQQLEMESNGKSATHEGKPVTLATAPVIWGEPGTNGPHAFFQMLHQGTDIVPVDFIVAAQPIQADAEHHPLLVANCLAQRPYAHKARPVDQDCAGSSAHR